MNIIQRPAHTSNYSKDRAHVIDQITFHHIVGNAPSGTDGALQAGHGVSPTYAIAADGTIYQYVQEKDTPWTDGSASSNARAITIEHAGPPYTEAMYRASAELCRDIMSRYPITRFERHRDVIDKSVYPGGTACPGQLDVERIVKAAQQGGNNMIENETQNDLVFLVGCSRHALAQEKGRYIGKAWEYALNDVLKNADRVKQDVIVQTAGKFKPVTKQLYEL